MEIVASAVTISTNHLTMSAHLARPKALNAPAVIVIHEAFGLVPHIKDVAERFAREGFVSLAPDFYVRQGGKTTPYTDLDHALKLAGAVDYELFLKDMSASIDYLLKQDFVKSGKVGAVGFCMGGRLAFLTACRNATISGSVVFYGGGIAGLIDLIDGIRCPILGFFGDEDHNPSPSDVKKVEQALISKRKSHEFRSYPKAGHGFFCNERPSYRAEAAKDAWDRTLDFFRKQLKV